MFIFCLLKSVTSQRASSANQQYLQFRETPILSSPIHCRLIGRAKMPFVTISWHCMQSLEQNSNILKTFGAITLHSMER